MENQSVPSSLVKDTAHHDEESEDTAHHDEESAIEVTEEQKAAVVDSIQSEDQELTGPDESLTPAQLKLNHSVNCFPTATDTHQEEESGIESSQDQNHVLETKKRPRSLSEVGTHGEDQDRKKGRVPLENSEDCPEFEGSHDTFGQRQLPIQLSDTSRVSPDHFESAKTAIQSATSNPGVLRPDLIAAILGSSPKAGPAPIAVHIPAKELAVQKKKKMNKPPPVKVLKAMKEVKDAKELLGGQADLAMILSEQECRFLAENQWIVTAQQLENVLHPQSEEHTQAQQELIEALARSPLVANNAHAEPNSDHKVSYNDVSREIEISLLENAEGSSKILEGGSPNPADSGTTGPPQSVIQDIRLVQLNEEDDGQHSTKATFPAPRDRISGNPRTNQENVPSIPHAFHGTDRANVDSESRSKESQSVFQDIGLVLVEEQDEHHYSMEAAVPAPGDSISATTQTKQQSPESSPRKCCHTDHANADQNPHENETPAVTTEKTQASPVVTSTTSVHDISSSVGMTASFGPEAVYTLKQDVEEKPATINVNEGAVRKGHGEGHSGWTSRESSEMGDTKRTTYDSGCTDSSISAAIRLMEYWSEKLRSRGDDQSFGGVDEKFFLDGPVSFLFPKCTRNFLKSAKIDTVFKFLCFKRTETGIIVDVYAAWRKKCEIVDRPRISIAKHLVALGARVEALIGSPCPLSRKERQWLGDHTVVLGGSAKDFLFDIGIVDANLFLKTMTKKLSNKLERWRENKGLQPLKGTGKVAMVSAWKTQIREAQELELEDGHVLGDDWIKSQNMEQSDASNELQHVKKNLRKQPPFQKKQDSVAMEARSSSTRKSISSRARLLESSDQSMEAELQSSNLLGTVFKEDAVKLMTSIGIRSGNDLLSADPTPDSSLVGAMIAVCHDFSVDADAGTCIDQVLEWQKTLKLGIAKRKKKVEKMKPENVRKQEKLQQEQQQRDRPAPKLIRNLSKKTLSSPWEILSDSAKNFLASIDITDAEIFLASKTKHLAERLVKYRENHNLAPLRGSGAVASVSGWKALVRNAAVELGQYDLANLNAGRNAGIKLKRRKRTGEDDEDVSERNMNEPMPGAAPLVSKIRRIEPPVAVQHYIATAEFSVQHAGEVFSFDLSVRQNSRDPSSLSYYLTYHGSERMKAAGERAEELDVDLAVLDHVPAINGFKASGPGKPFVSLQTGLIDLERYGIEPTPKRDELSIIRKHLKSFISQEDTAEFLGPSIVYNVFERREGSGKKYYFFARSVLEKGQTVELNFLPPSPPTFSDDQFRKWINQELDELQIKDLRSLLDFINEVIGTDTYSSFETIFKKDVSGEGTSSDHWSDEQVGEIKRLVVARRRMHWLALKIDAAMEKVSSKNGENTTSTLPAAIAPLWSNPLISSMSKHPLWQDQIRPRMVEESRNEILTEFQSPALGGFWTSQDLWCAVARSTFSETISLLSQFNAELECFSSGEKLIDNLAKIVIDAVSNLQKLYSDHASPTSDLEQVLLNFDRSVEHTSNLLPSIAALWANLNQNYLDGMALACEPPLDASLNDEGRFLAVKRHSATAEASPKSSTEFRFVHDLDMSKEVIDLEWYIQAQVVSVAESLAVCGAKLLFRGSSELSNLSSKLLERVANALGRDGLSSVELRERSKEEKLSIPLEILDITGNQIGKPASRSIFLCLVWPYLRKMKWRIEAGTLTSSVTYLPPGQNKDKRTRFLRQEAAAARGRMARKTTELGVGGIPKDVKRLFVCCAAAAGDFDADEISDRQLTVAEALRCFEESFSSSTSYISAILEQLKVLFEKIAPSLLYKDWSISSTPPSPIRWSDHLGSEYLVRLILILPTILNHSAVSFPEVENIMGVVKELLSYLAKNRDNLFAKAFQYPHEEYANDFMFKTFVDERLERAPAAGGEVSTDNRPSMMSDLKEIVLPSDRYELTDFVITVMDQVIVCRATPADVNSRGRRSFLTVGAPGLVCRHCLGQTGEGKYFYSNMQSLATASTSVDKHILRCPKISAEIKSRMLEAKTRNAEQRSKTRPGAQSAFFVRLWNRLQQSRRLSAESEANMFVTLRTFDSEQAEDVTARSVSSGDDQGFRDHVEVLRYIQAEEPWKSRLELKDAVSDYYSCLCWGAGIFGTPAMPQNYSSEMVLAKLGYR